MTDHSKSEVNFLTNLLKIVRPVRRKFDPYDASIRWDSRPVALTVAATTTERLFGNNPNRFAIVINVNSATFWTIAPWSFSTQAEGWTLQSNNDNHVIFSRENVGGLTEGEWFIRNDGFGGVTLNATEIFVA